MEMNEEQAVAYAIMAIYTLQNSANGDYRLKDIKLKDIEEEMKVMFRIYNKNSVIVAIKRIFL